MEPNETDKVINTPQSEWYCYTLACSHEVYTKVRLSYEKPHRQTHKIRCPRCDDRKKRKPDQVPTAWQAVTDIKDVTNEHVSNVSSGFAFVLPNRIMRIDNVGGTGNPFPYTTSKREY